MTLIISELFSWHVWSFIYAERRCCIDLLSTFRPVLDIREPRQRKIFFFFEKTFNRTSCLVFINANFFGIIVSWSNQAQHKLNRILTWTIEDIYFFGMSNFVASILTHLGLSLINSLLSFLLGSWFVGKKLQKVVFYPNVICSSSKLNLESFQYKTKHYCCI